MTKPNDTTRDRDKYKRQLKMLEFYVSGRIIQLAHIAKTSPGEASACDMATGELQSILDKVLPIMREVQA